MNIKTELHSSVIERLPQTGKQIIGYQEDDCIVVYQAYNPAIANFAVANQKLGGSHFSYNRMSWIKPGFLWMMYRCGWATKENQERVLALWITKADFISLLSNSVPTTYKPKLYADNASWKADLKTKDVRVQWDPDHSPFGQKQERKAIQVGLKDKSLELFGQHYVRKIEDVTEFVLQQSQLLKQNRIAELLIPSEAIMETNDPKLDLWLGIQNV